MRPSDFTLDRYLLGELPAAERERLDAALAADPALRARLDALREEGRGLLEALPAREVAAEVGRRLRVARAAAPPRGRAALLVATPLLVGAALAGLVALRGRGDTLVTAAAVEEPLEQTRAKGDGPRLALYRRTGERGEPLRPGDAARPREVLQVAYAASGRRHGVVVSIDGRGEVTVHLPEQGETSATLERKGEVALPHAYELDDAPGFERFFLVTADAPFSVEAVTRAARALAADLERAAREPLALEGALEQRAFLIRKVAR